MKTLASENVLVTSSPTASSCKIKMHSKLLEHPPGGSNLSPVVDGNLQVSEEVFVNLEDFPHTTGELEHLIKSQRQNEHFFPLIFHSFQVYENYKNSAVKHDI